MYFKKTEVGMDAVTWKKTEKEQDLEIQLNFLQKTVDGHYSKLKASDYTAQRLTYPWTESPTLDEGYYHSVR